MPTLPEAPVVKAWDDPAYAQAILKKGERRASRTVKPARVVAEKSPTLCTNCGKPYSMYAFDPCACSIWERGKLKAA